MPTKTSHDLQISKAVAVGLILRRPYWRRAWIVQEVCVSPSDPLIVCGSRKIFWTPFNLGLFNLRAYWRQRSYLGTLVPFDIFFNLNYMRRPYQGGRSAPLREHGIGEPRTNLYDLLDSSTRCLATEPRDHIYSLLCLIRDVNSSSSLDIMLPNYAKAVSWTYREAARMFVHLEGTLEFLNLRAGHLPPCWLPSWVPDFSSFSAANAMIYPSIASDPWHKWSAAGPLRQDHHKSFPYVTGKDLSTLITNGTIIDRVVEIIKIDGSTPAEAVCRVRQKVVSRRRRGTMTTRAEPTFQEDLEETIWRTLIGNRGAENERPCPPEYGNYYEELFKVNQTGDPIQTTTNCVNLFQRAMKTATCYGAGFPCRCVLQFKEMGIGFGPPDCEVGDHLSLLGGYSMPVMLRPFGNFFDLLDLLLFMALCMGRY